MELPVQKTGSSSGILEAIIFADETHAPDRMLGKDSKRNAGGVCCPFRKLYPDILMMQSGQDWDGDNDAGPLDYSMQGRIFL